jgi:hypothetical protein
MAKAKAAARSWPWRAAGICFWLLIIIGLAYFLAPVFGSVLEQLSDTQKTLLGSGAASRR